MNFFNRNKLERAKLELQIQTLKGQINAVQQMRELTSYGATGIKNIMGQYFQTDYNGIWDNQNQRYDKIAEMKNDAIIAACLEAIMLPIMSCPVMVQPVSKSNLDLRIAEAVEKQLFESDKFTWSDLQNWILEMVAYGFSLFEKVRYFHPKNRLWMYDLQPRIQSTIEGWHLDENGRLRTVEQFVYKNGSYQSAFMPNEAVLLFNVKQTGNDYRGNSLLRQIFFNWHSKTIMNKIYTLTVQLWGLKAPVIHLPEMQHDNDLEKAQEVAQNWISHESQYMVLPYGFQASTLGDTGNMPDISRALEFHDKQIATRFLADFLMLGGAKGSYALSRDKSDFFLMSIQYIINRIEDVLSRETGGRTFIPEFVKLNFGERAESPAVKYSKLIDIDLNKLAITLASLAEKQFIVPTEEIRDYLLEALELPTEQTIIRQAATKPVIKDKMQPDGQQKEEPEGEGAQEGEKEAEEIETHSHHAGEIHLMDSPDFAFNRELTDQEKSVSNLEKIKAELNKAKADITKICNDWRAKSTEVLCEAGIKYLAKGMPSKEFEEALNQELISQRLLKKRDVTRLIEVELTTIYRFGIQSFIDDLAKQGISVNFMLQDVNEEGNTVVKTLAAIIISFLADKLLFNWKLELIRQKLSNLVDKVGLRSLLEKLTKGDTLRKVTEGVLKSFGISRNSTAEKYDAEIQILRSEIMDGRTCKECRKIDKKIFDFSDALWQDVKTGAYTRCEGGMLCRGINLFMKQE